MYGGAHLRLTVKLNCKDSARRREFSQDTTVSSHTEYSGAAERNSKWWDHGAGAKAVNYSRRFKGIYLQEILKTRGRFGYGHSVLVTL